MDPATLAQVEAASASATFDARRPSGLKLDLDVSRHCDDEVGAMLLQRHARRVEAAKALLQFLEDNPAGGSGEAHEECYREHGKAVAKLNGRKEEKGNGSSAEHWDKGAPTLKSRMAIRHANRDRAELADQAAFEKAATAKVNKVAKAQELLGKAPAYVAKLRELKNLAEETLIEAKVCTIPLAESVLMRMGVTEYAKGDRATVLKSLAAAIQQHGLPATPRPCRGRHRRRRRRRRQPTKARRRGVRTC